MSKIIMKADYLKSSKKEHIKNSINYNEKKGEKVQKEECNENHIATSIKYNERKSASLINQNGEIDVETELGHMLDTKNNIYRFILSISEEDSIKKDLMNIAAWEKICKRNIVDIADELNINLKNLRWNIALHLDKEHHPHIHMHVWNASQKDNSYLKKNSIIKIRKKLIKDVFKEEIQMNIKKQHEIEEKLIKHLTPKKIEKRLSSNKYGYLKEEEKKLINKFLKENISNELLKKYIELKWDYQKMFGTKETEIKEEVSKMKELTFDEKEKLIKEKIEKMVREEKLNIYNTIINPKKKEKAIFQNYILKNDLRSSRNEIKDIKEQKELSELKELDSKAKVNFDKFTNVVMNLTKGTKQDKAKQNRKTNDNKINKNKNSKKRRKGMNKYKSTHSIER